MTPTGSIPIGTFGWALVRKRPFEVLSMFQSRELAEKAAINIGGLGYEVRYGKIEKGTGNFVSEAVDRQR